jgi:large repetitive protein
MMRVHKRFLPSLLLFVACASDPETAAPPSEPDQPATVKEQMALTMGMSILSSDAKGAPRLMRSIRPRASLAGAAPEAAARAHVSALEALWVQGTPAMALSGLGTQPLRNGATVVRLAQQLDGVVVHNGELRVMMHADGSLAAVSGTLLPASIKPTFVSTPAQALQRSLDQLYGKLRAQPAVTEAGERDGWMHFTVADDPALRVNQARARRELVGVGDKLTEVWSVEVLGDAGPDPLRDPSISEPVAHRYLIGDADGRVVSDTNLVKNDAFVYRVYAEPNGVRRPFDGALQSFAPHPTGLPDGSAPDFASSNVVAVDSFNGPLDPWLPGNATTTAGNNVIAFSDLDGTRSFTDGDVRPEVRSGRVLNFRYDTSAEPLGNPDQLKAGAVNVFFVNNWLHDWFYDSGFTEATGNAQVDNYGRGGVGGDPLLAMAQANALGGSRNNANMSTPADGLSPVMNMFLWTAGLDTALTTDAGSFVSEAFAVGPRAFDFTGELLAALDGTAPTNDGCQPHTRDLTGKIAVVVFSGACGSAATVNNARAAGAAGIILIDGALDNPRAFAGSAAANIPGLAIGRADGQTLLAAMEQGPVSATLHSAPNGPERDGDLDNTVIAHEWGHYLHHRLAVCDSGQQCGGMSEGWGDFSSLLMMLRDDDNRDGTYAVGPYAVANGAPDTAYFGIRRFPYSRDRGKNDLSFRHITTGVPLPTHTPGGGGVASSEVHAAGEVWTSMLWEALNVLIDDHGTAIGRRRMTDYVVAGLLLTPPEATYTEGRDAILAAASALDSDDMLLMAAAFAGRGAGSCAVSPSNDNRNNVGVVESGTVAGKLVISSATILEDGRSCDRDGYLDPGETGTLVVSIANAGVLTAENVVVAASTATTSVRLGAPVRVGALRPFTTSELRIPITMSLTAPRNATLTINLRATGEDTCDRGGITAAAQELVGVDEVAASSRIDRVETRQSPWTAAGASAATLWGRATEADRNHLWLGKNAGFPSDTQLVSPVLAASATDPLIVTISHAYNLEGAGAQLFDGGVIEVSTDGGATFNDVANLGVNPGYTGRLVATGANPIAGRLAFSGASPGYPARRPLVLDFGTQFAGQNVLLRFRIGTDLNAAAVGWFIDDIDVQGITNTPFSTLVSEPSTCAGRTPHVAESAVVTTFEAPRTSLRGYDNATCVAADSQ